jgi:hypothetical protein
LTGAFGGPWSVHDAASTEHVAQPPNTSVFTLCNIKIVPPFAISGVSTTPSRCTAGNCLPRLVSIRVLLLGLHLKLVHLPRRSEVQKLLLPRKHAKSCRTSYPSWTPNRAELEDTTTLSAGKWRVEPLLSGN